MSATVSGLAWRSNAQCLGGSCFGGAATFKKKRDVWATAKLPDTTCTPTAGAADPRLAHGTRRNRCMMLAGTTAA